MTLTRRILGLETLRLLLAATVLLATLAGARLQGEMAGARAAGLPAVAMLCSGMMAPIPEDVDRATGAHCIECNLPVAIAAVPPEPVYRPLLAGHIALAVVAQETPACARSVYSARGPPAQV